MRIGTLPVSSLFSSLRTLLSLCWMGAWNCQIKPPKSKRTQYVRQYFLSDMDRLNEGKRTDQRIFNVETPKQRLYGDLQTEARSLVQIEWHHCSIFAGTGTGVLTSTGARRENGSEREAIECAPVRSPWRLSRRVRAPCLSIRRARVTDEREEGWLSIYPYYWILILYQTYL